MTSASSVREVSQILGDHAVKPRKKTPKISCSLLFTKVLPLIPAISSLITGILVDLHVGNDMKHDVLDFIEILCIFEGLGSCSAKIGS